MEFYPEGNNNSPEGKATTWDYCNVVGTPKHGSNGQMLYSSERMFCAAGEVGEGALIGLNQEVAFHVQCWQVLTSGYAICCFAMP